MCHTGPKTNNSNLLYVYSKYGISEASHDMKSSLNLKQEMDQRKDVLISVNFGLWCESQFQDQIKVRT